MSLYILIFDSIDFIKGREIGFSLVVEKETHLSCSEGKSD
jgi:hypothetical protein